jgi:N-acetylmuramoyl-L-alanine amidase
MARIGLDIGHGGTDPGAVSGIRPELGDHLNSQEKNIVLPVGLELERLLKLAGYEVRTTRRTDQALSLQGRTKILNDAKCDFVISLHVNSSTSSVPNYISTFIQGVGGEAEKLAKCIQPRIVQASGWPDGGVRVANLHMTRETKMPAVLVELGFISNPEQEKLLVQKEFQQKIASAIASGIIDYAGGATRKTCIIRIKGQEFPGYIVGGVSYFGEGVAVRDVVNAINLSLDWDSKNLVADIK